MRKRILLTLAMIVSSRSGMGQTPVTFPSSAPVTLEGNLTATAGQNQINAQVLETAQIVDSSLGRGGVDIGDEINKAYAACPTPASICTILLGINATGGFYSYTTPIVAATKGRLTVNWRVAR